MMNVYEVRFPAENGDASVFYVASSLEELLIGIENLRRERRILSIVEIFAGVEVLK